MQLFTQCSQCFSPVTGTRGDKSWVSRRGKWKHSNAPWRKARLSWFPSAFGANQSDLNFTGVLFKWLHGKLLKMFRGDCCWQISYIFLLHKCVCVWGGTGKTGLFLFKFYFYCLQYATNTLTFHKWAGQRRFKRKPVLNCGIFASN